MNIFEFPDGIIRVYTEDSSVNLLIFLSMFYHFEPRIVIMVILYFFSFDPEMLHK